MKRYLRSAALLVSVLLAAVVLTSCLGGKGLSGAYKKLTKDGENAAISYDEKLDRLTLTFNNDGLDPAEVFDILDKAVEEEDIGEVRFLRGADQLANEELMHEVSKRIGKLPFKSCRMLILGIDPSMLGGGWTGVLDRVDTLYAYNVSTMFMDQYEQSEQDMIAKVKKLKYYDGDMTSLGFALFRSFTGLEELTLSAGLSPDEISQKDASGFGLYVDDSSVDVLKNYKSLKKLLIYPEALTWTGGETYYDLAFELKRAIPEVLTNIPGSAKSDGGAEGGDASSDESGDESKEDEGEEKVAEPELVAFKDYRILKDAPKDVKERILKEVLKEDAETCYKKGRKFKKSSSKPELVGKCLIYYGEPSESEFNKDKLYTLTRNIMLRSDLKSKKIRMPEDIGDYRMFVYIYGKYSFYGNYDKGTKGYATKTMVRVYDMERRIKYDPVEVNSENPPHSFRYYGSTPPKTHYPSLKIDKARKYIKGLKYSKK